MLPLVEVVKNAFRPEDHSFLVRKTKHAAAGLRQAVVAAVLRVDPVSRESLQLLYILRAQRSRDRWSAHVGFPGGHGHRGESLLETARREVREEVGLRLDDDAHFAVCGSLTAVGYPILSSALTVFVVVFMQKTVCNLPMTLEPAEVSAAQWVSLSYLCAPPKPWPTLEAMHSSTGSRSKHSKSKLNANNALSQTTQKTTTVSRTGIHRYSQNHAHLAMAWKFSSWFRPLPAVFAAIVLPANVCTEHIAYANENATEKRKSGRIEWQRKFGWVLWGLTYRFTAQIIDALHFPNHLQPEFSHSLVWKLLANALGLRPTLRPVKRPSKVSAKEIEVSEETEEETDEGLYLRDDEEMQSVDSNQLNATLKSKL